MAGLHAAETPCVFFWKLRPVPLAHFSAYAAQRLRRLGRLAATRGTDAKIDYTRSHTASSFVPYFAQRLSTACAIFGAECILVALKVARADRLRAA